MLPEISKSSFTPHPGYGLAVVVVVVANVVVDTVPIPLQSLFGKGNQIKNRNNCTKIFRAIFNHDLSIYT